MAKDEKGEPKGTYTLTADRWTDPKGEEHFVGEEVELTEEEFKRLSQSGPDRTGNVRRAAVAEKDSYAAKRARGEIVEDVEPEEANAPTEDVQAKIDALKAILEDREKAPEAPAEAEQPTAKKPSS